MVAAKMLCPQEKSALKSCEKKARIGSSAIPYRPKQNASACLPRKPGLAAGVHCSNYSEETAKSAKEESHTPISSALTVRIQS